jgi:hypothetical protein
MQIHGQIAAMLQTLAPYIIALIPRERKTMFKMGDKSLAFVEKAHDYAADNPVLVPSYLDMAGCCGAEPRRGGSVRRRLRRLERGVGNLCCRDFPLLNLREAGFGAGSFNIPLTNPKHCVISPSYN